MTIKLQKVQEYQKEKPPIFFKGIYRVPHPRAIIRDVKFEPWPPLLIQINLSVK